MRLNNIKSSLLLPEQSSNQGEASISERLEWVCNAFDTYIKSIDSRRLALAAPYSMEAIKKLTDEELQQYFREFDLATYYPDIPREARENMLYEQYRIFRILGTKAAIQTMIQYIFGNNPISLEIIDNLAFDENGSLTDSSLLNLYDAIVTVENPTLDNFQLVRIFNNLTRFNRASQKLRSIAMRYEGGGINLYSGVGSLDYAAFYDNDNIPCTYGVLPTTLNIGIDTDIPSSAIGLSSVYYWFYAFNGGNSYGNLWNPDYIADNVNPQNPDPNESSIPSSYYNNVWLYNGSNIYDMNGSGTLFRLAVYNNKPEFYTNASDISATGANSACVVEAVDNQYMFGQEFFSLPSDLYTIRGTSISWNSSHVLYQILYGKEANILY